MDILNHARRAWNRPVHAGSVFLSYVGIVAVFAFTWGSFRVESENRATGLCAVVSNVHAAAVERANASAKAVRDTRDYLQDPASKESPALYKRVKANFPATIERAKNDARSVRATTPPASCNTLTNKDQNASR